MNHRRPIMFISNLIEIMFIVYLDAVDPEPLPSSKEKRVGCFFYIRAI